LRVSANAFAAVALLAIAPATYTSAQEPASPLGRTVVSVAYTCDGPVDDAELARLITIVAGRPLTEDDTGATIRNLFSTGRFANVAVEAEPQDGGVSGACSAFPRGTCTRRRSSTTGRLS
jgi:outer membrane protein assembly factor BamA